MNPQIIDMMAAGLFTAALTPAPLVFFRPEIPEPPQSSSDGVHRRAPMFHPTA